MAIVAGGGQAELAVVHERTAMPVPEELDWTAAGGVPEAFTTAHDALFTQAGLTVRRAAARPRRRGRGRDGGRPARRDGRRASPRPSATSSTGRRSRRSASHAIAPEELREGGRVRRDPRARRRAEPVREPRRARDRRADLHHRRRRGAKTEIDLRQADGQARAHPRLRRCATGRSRRRRSPRGWWRRWCCPGSRRATSSRAR